MKEDNDYKKKYISVLDPIPYFGGSKVASKTYLDLLKRKNLCIEIFTHDPMTWKEEGFCVSAYTENKAISKYEYGLGFYIKNILITIQYSFHLLKLIFKYRQPPALIIGISGPGIDVAAYCVAWILKKTKIVQLVHGPVGQSRLTKNLINQANTIACLNSEIESINTMLDKKNKAHSKNVPTLVEMKNGIAEQDWPTASNSNFSEPHILWAASLLKWKRLDFYIKAFKGASCNQKMRTTIAYITPKNTNHDLCELPNSCKNVDAVEKPIDMDKRRSTCNIFVSTSKSEPFGLSILEALAAGLCVVIPEDGAYWDKNLTHGHNCIKYFADQPESLSQALIDIAKDMQRTKKIALQGKHVAEQYRAEKTYANIVSASVSILSAPDYLSGEVLK